LRDALAGKPRIELLACDVDGVLTDGGMYFGVGGQALKRFNVKDGLGLALVRDSGVRVAFITTDSSEIGRIRGEKLGVTEVCLGVPDKLACLRDMMDRHNLVPEAVIYVGDDLPDLGLAAVVGTFIAPADAVPEVRAAAAFVTSASGGQGAVREVCDLILRHNADLARSDSQ